MHEKSGVGVSPGVKTPAILPPMGHPNLNSAPVRPLQLTSFNRNEPEPKSTEQTLLDLLKVDKYATLAAETDSHSITSANFNTTNFKKAKHPRSHCQFKGVEIFTKSVGDQIHDPVDEICKIWRETIFTEAETFEKNCFSMKSPLNFYVCEPFLDSLQLFFQKLKDSDILEDWCTIRYCWLIGNLVELLPLLEIN